MSGRELFFRHLGLPSLRPMGLEIVSAEGVMLTGADGREYYDMVSGISVSNVGHRHPVVISAILEQLEKYLHLNVYGEFIQSPQVHLAVKLATLLPSSLDSVYLVNSGSEAIEGAMKLAKRYTGKTELIAFRNAYHGSTQGALSILGNETLKEAFRPLLPDVRFLKFNNLEDLEQITHRTACVVVESVQAEAGVILPERDFLIRLRERCTETGTLMVLDDVQLGFGRTGTMFSFEQYGFVPDILVVAKAMGGGMPIGAFISSKAIMETLTFNPELGHITTFGGHPVSCAAALAAIEVIEGEDLLRETEAKGAFIEKELGTHAAIRFVRRKGLLLGLGLRDAGKRAAFTAACLENGVIIDWFLFQEATFRLAPPLTITFPELSDACSRIRLSLDRI